MYVVVYLFKVKPNQEQKFIDGWKGLTKLIYKHESSLGSRLHLETEGQYIAYAQWPDKITFEASSNNLPEEANTFRNLMRMSCETIEVLNKMEVVEDMLIKAQND